jgi:NAD-dependent dihydropyrimidine dehydrogenase PreA subunit
MQGFVDKINAFTVRIKLDECVKCGKCKTVCPMMAIDDKSFTSGKPNNGCVKCGRCVDECPKKAVVFQIRGLPVGKLASFSRAAFMFTAFLIMASMGGSFIKDAMHRLFLLVSTGSILK